MVVFDIETSPLPPAEMPPFDPGEPPKNISKPETLADWRAKKEIEWQEKAALSPETGYVLAIGALLVDKGGQKLRLFKGMEADILAEWWSFWVEGLITGHFFCGYASTFFDLPFLVMRSLKLGIRIPGDVTDAYQLKRNHVDVYMRLPAKHQMSLDKLAAWMGIPGKLGDGKHFAEAFKNEATRKNALDYLKRDLEITLEAARRLGVF